MVKSSGHEVRIPDVEVLIQAANSDVALVSFYIPADRRNDVEVVAAVADGTELGGIREALRLALQALNAANWQSMDELDTGSVSEEPSVPF